MIIPDIESDEDKERISFIYDYIKRSIESNENSLRSSDTKLASIIALSGTYLLLIKTLPIKPFTEEAISYTCYSLIFLKILVCICLIIAIIFAFVGFIPKKYNNETSPSRLIELRNKCKTTQYIKLEIIYTWLEELDEFDRLRDDKAKYVKYSLISLSAAAISATLNLLLASLIPIL